MAVHAPIPERGDIVATIIRLETRAREHPKLTSVANLAVLLVATTVLFAVLAAGLLITVLMTALH